MTEEIRPPSLVEGNQYQALDELVSNVYIRAMRLTMEGVCVTGHEHPYPHISILARGKVRVKVNGQTTEYDAEAKKWPVLIYVEKDLRHEFTALSDDVVLVCCHASRDKAGDVIDADMVPNGVMTPELRADLSSVVGRSDKLAGKLD